MSTTTTDVLTHQDALKIVTSAAGGAACPVHEVGPVANHIIGPVSALRPEGHADHAAQWTSYTRSQDAVDRLIADAVNGDIACTCGDQSRHPLAYVIRKISAGAFIRAHPNSLAWQRHLDKALKSVDVDLLTYYVEPRLDVLKVLADRARAEHGGDLPPLVLDAVTTLVKSLAGLTRWDVISGYSYGWPWSAEWRPGVVASQANDFMRHEVVCRVALRRLSKGAL